MEESAENPEKAPLTAGAMIRKTRLAAGVEAADLCSSLRISIAALEAVEAGQYQRLPGEPYVRALLGSIARFLGMDPQKLLNAYYFETGAAASQSSAVPYQDVSQTHAQAHRKLFIALLAALLIALLFILARVNSSSGKNQAAENAARRDTLSLAAPPPAESLAVSAALQPDSTVIAGAPGAKTTAADSGQAAHKTAVAGSAVHPVNPGDMMNRVVVKALFDSTIFRAYHKGRWSVTETLSLGKRTEVNRRDTINFVLYRTKSVELSFADTTLVPVKRHFRIFGKSISYF
jgi:cytoskeletal protein RodZ